jgi:hypothetical protein
MQLSKSFFALFFAVLCVKTAHAQNNLSEGYYVGFKKDTVRGFFDFDNLATHKVSFYAQKKGSVSQKLTPDNVQQIETTDKSIRTFIYNFKDQKQALFIIKYVDGNVALYKSTSLNPEEPEVFFINSKKMPLVRKISAINPKVFLNTYFKGCELGTNFSVKYSENSLLAAVTEISKCAYPDVKENSEGQIKKINGSKINIEMGLKLGYFRNQSVVRGWFGDRVTDVFYKPLVGAVLVFNISNSFKIYSGLNYFQRHLTSPLPIEIVLYGTTQTSRFDYYKASSLNLETNLFEIPFSLNYEFNKKNPKYIPKVFTGISLLINQSAKFDIQPYFPASLKEPYPVKLYESNRNYSFSIGGGVKRILKNSSSIEMNLKYALESEDPTDDGRIFSDRYELSINYLFSLGKKD